MGDLYDYVIVGAGPCGLTLAYTLSFYKYRVVLIDKETTIGGCHRVNRVDGLFTEHGPRVYSDAYVNTIRLLKHMDLDFYDLFSPYDPDKWSFFRLKPLELFMCFFEYCKLLINQDYGKDRSVDWLTSRFSNDSKNFTDRLCRLTDGAGSDRYTLHQFLCLFDQNMLHGVYIPKEPNDVGLLKKWRLNNTDLKLGNKIKSIVVNGNRVDSLTLYNDEIVKGKNFLFCIPPLSLIELIKDSPVVNAFGDYSKLVKWSIGTGYNSYIPIVYHWDTLVDIPKKWGFPVSDWGIAFIIMSRYMKFNESRSKTVISTCIMYNDKKSLITGKTANESTIEELISEVFRQLKEAFGGINIPQYTQAIPNTIYKIDGVWYDKDKSFVVTPDVKFLSQKSILYDNLYSVGTHNGDSYYSFTTFESAVTNSLSMLHKLIPHSSRDFPIKKPQSLSNILRTVFIILILILIIYIYRVKFVHN